jgi:RNA polymerase sigma-70 factor (ECF subfamily)
VDDSRLIQLEVSDDALAARVARRDVDAFAALYDRYAQVVYAMAAHMLGIGEAEEVVQEVFLRLWDRAGQFDAARGPFNAWFVTIARNYILDRLRRRGQQQRLFIAGEISGFLEEVADQSVDVEEEAWARERGDAVLGALRELPAEQRRVLVLAYFGGLSQSAIAELLGCPYGTVKKRMRLGMKKLRVALARQGLVEFSGTVEDDGDEGDAVD